MDEAKPPRSTKKRDSRVDNDAEPREETSGMSSVSRMSSAPSRSSAPTKSSAPERSSVPSRVPAAGPSSPSSPPADALRHYETLSNLHRQLAEVEGVLAAERRDRDAEADRMATLLVRLAEHELQAREAEERAATASERVATLESELVTAQIVAAAIDEQLIATEDALDRVAQATRLASHPPARVTDEIAPEPGGFGEASDEDKTRRFARVIPFAAKVDELVALRSSLADAELAQRAAVAGREAAEEEARGLRESIAEMRERVETLSATLDRMKELFGSLVLPK